MRTITNSLVILTTLLLVACATSGDSKESWKCEAQNMGNYHYTGGDTAMIRLSQFSTGDRYKVTKNPEGTVATGTTANGTPFKCTKNN